MGLQPNKHLTTFPMLRRHRPPSFVRLVARFASFFPHSVSPFSPSSTALPFCVDLTPTTTRTRVYPLSLASTSTFVPCPTSIHPRCVSWGTTWHLRPRLSPAPSYSAPSYSSWNMRLYTRFLFSRSAAGGGQETDPVVPASEREHSQPPQHPSVEWETVYEGPLSAAVIRLKYFSLSSLIITTISAPVLYILGNQEISPAGRLAMSGAVMCIGVGSTLFMNFCMTPYVLTAQYHALRPDLVKFTSLDFFAKPVDTYVDLAEDGATTTTVSRPMASFVVKRTHKHFYVHEDFATHHIFERILPENFVPVDEDDQEAEERKGGTVRVSGDHPSK